MRCCSSDRTDAPNLTVPKRSPKDLDILLCLLDGAERRLRLQVKLNAVCRDLGPDRRTPSVEKKPRLPFSVSVPSARDLTLPACRADPSRQLPLATLLAKPGLSIAAANHLTAPKQNPLLDRSFGIFG